MKILTLIVNSSFSLEEIEMFSSFFEETEEFSFDNLSDRLKIIINAVECYTFTEALIEISKNEMPPLIAVETIHGDVLKLRSILDLAVALIVDRKMMELGE